MTAVAAVTTIKFGTVAAISRHLLFWDIPEKMNWWILGSTLSWVGAGPTLLWYTYWMKDAGWGMAWLFFFNNQMAISEAVVRQNADATMTFLGKSDIKKVYFVWWEVYLATIIGQVLLYKDFPKELRPSRLSVVVLSAGFVFYVYVIVRALLSFFGKA